jgi:hypothetical protein
VVKHGTTPFSRHRERNGLELLEKGVMRGQIQIKNPEVFLLLHRSGVQKEKKQPYF